MKACKYAINSRKYASGKKDLKQYVHSEKFADAQRGVTRMQEYKNANKLLCPPKNMIKNDTRTSKSENLNHHIIRVKE